MASGTGGYNAGAYGDDGWNDGIVLSETGIAATLALGSETASGGAQINQVGLDNFKININDELSGFDPSPKSFDLFLNGKEIFYAFQPKLKTLSYQLDEPLSIGNHMLSVKITDQAGNTLEKEIKFNVY